MKFTFLQIALLCLPVTLSGQALPYPTENMKPEVKPGNDFLKYAAGNWIDNHPLRDDQFRNGAFIDCSDSVTARLNRILTDLIVRPQEPNSVSEKMRTIYLQHSDTAQRNEDGIKSLEADLMAIRKAKSTLELQQVMSRLDRTGAPTSLVSWFIGPDLLEAENNIVITYLPNTVMTSNYYNYNTKKNRVVRKAYFTFGVQLFKALGYSEEQAEFRMGLAYFIEEQLAKSYKNKYNRGDFKDEVHKMSLAELCTKYPNISWKDLFSSASGPLDVRTIDVRKKKAISIADHLLRTYNLAHFKAYAELHLAWSRLPYLTQSMRRDMQAFQASMQGEKAEDPQWRISANMLSETMEMPMGQLYCNNYFTAESRDRVLKIAEEIRQAFRQRLEQNTWMSPETKQEALKKLDQMHFLVGYPNQWSDYSQLDVNPQKSLVENIATINEFNYEEEIRKQLNLPVDIYDWGVSPQTVNAFYNATRNIIVLPAAILQPPFFDPQADEAINYGAIGTVIGHELTHGFDRNGCQFDGKGNVHNWWTKKDLRAFKKRTLLMIKYFNKLPINGHKVNGYQTLNENIADNGGIHIALQAMKLAGIKDTISGQTAEQRFFLSYARLWARQVRPDFLAYLVNVDTHAPNVLRVNKALPHIDEWYEAFGITPADSLYVPEEKRAKIW